MPVMGIKERAKMVSGKFFFTPHAVRQFIRRYVPHLRYEVALASLIRQSEFARFSRVCQHGNADVWRAPRPSRFRMVIRHGEGELPTVVTVL